MSERIIAIIGDGARPSTEDVRSREVGTSSMEVDRVVSLLAEIVMRAQSLPAADQRRTTGTSSWPAHSALAATTVLPKDDQKLFEAHLRSRCPSS
jgi:hypothetical protein